MAQISSYSKVWAFTHREAEKLFDGPVVIQEKVDGSQFSFGNLNGEFVCRSKGQDISHDEGGGMFAKARATAKRIFDTGTLPLGMVVRCECLDKPKHNTLAYARVPVGNIVIFDITIEDGTEKYLLPEMVHSYAIQWQLETVPLLHYGPIEVVEFKDKLKTWMERESFLGGPKIEGVVVKNYNHVDGFGKSLCGKYVSTEFKENNGAEWQKQSQGSKLEQLMDSFNKEAIWTKLVQHLRDEGELVNAPQDIGPLMKEFKTDFRAEHTDFIKDKLYAIFHEDIERTVLNGFPLWYKAKLVE